MSPIEIRITVALEERTLSVLEQLLKAAAMASLHVAPARPAAASVPPPAPPPAAPEPSPPPAEAEPVQVALREPPPEPFAPPKAKGPFITAGRAKRFDAARNAELEACWAIRPPLPLKEIAARISAISPQLGPVEAKVVAGQANGRKLGARYTAEERAAQARQMAAARVAPAEPEAAPVAPPVEAEILDWAESQGLHYTGRNLAVINAARVRAKLPAFPAAA